MSQWNKNHPGEGQPGEVTTAATTIREIATKLEQVKDKLSAETARVTDATWQGTSGTTFRDRAISTQTDLHLFAQWLTDTETALNVYGPGLTDIKTQQAHLRAKIKADEEEKAAARNGSTVTAAYSTATADLAAHRAQWDALETQRINLNAALRGQLSTMPSVSFIQLGAVMAASGHEAGKPLTNSDILTALIDNSEDIADGKNDPTTLAGLAELLRYTTMDPELADSYMQKTGGTELTNLLDRLDVIDANGGPHQTIVDIQCRLRTTFSVASATWDRDAADSFNSAMMEGTNAPLAVAYLYYDAANAPMSQTMSQSIAELIQIKELADGRPWVWSGNVTAMAGQMDAFVLTNGVDRSTLADPAYSALVQIANQPDAALDWITSDDHLEFWYSQRDWNHGEGASAPSILWASIQDTPGALLGEDCDIDRVRQLAKANADIINYWKDTVLTGKSSINEDGLQALAHVVTTQMPYWIETGIWQVNGLKEGARYDPRQEIDWMNGITGPACVISDRALIDLLRLISNSDTATETVIEGTEGLAHAMMTNTQGQIEASSYSESLGKVAAIYGLIDGSGIAHSLAAAQLHDAIAQGWIDSLSFASGFAPGGTVKDAIAAGGATVASNAWADTYATRVSELFNGTNPNDQQLEETRNSQLADLANQFIPVEILANKEGGSQDFADEAASRYELNRYPGAMS